ncbi:TylF/MycF/NovP-related O-methyltransferase, partial [Acinetobacter baumannii]|uniref:TylF/MycF/NovP-related O-methyltransferase n=1 Tax=Acinetobacter baumannii TaxID=470 RepID=UPI00312C9AB3
KHALLLDGDFVECGVWRGGNALAAKMVFEHYGSDKRVWLFDTFGGMTEPSDMDRTANGEPAIDKFLASQRIDRNEWCYASLED